MEADECLQQMDINFETIIYDSVLDDDLIKEELVVGETEVIAEEEIDYNDDRDVNFDDTNCDVNRDLNDYDDNCSNNLDGQNEISSKSKFNGLSKTKDFSEIKDNQAETNFINQSNEEKLERDNCNVKSSEDNLIESKGKDATFIPAKDAWSYFTGLKVKQFTSQELEAFKKPFEMGWRREVVLRGTVTNSGKKIGDVYYFSPDKKVKLRSYIEMGSYLKKHPDCNLEPENFTFARQPIYKYPEEIVRHAMQRNQPSEAKPNSAPVKQHSQISQSTSNVAMKSATSSDSSTLDEIKSVAEGRSIVYFQNIN